MAKADLIENKIVEKITKELKDRFNEKPKFDFSTMKPGDILAYSFLLKTLLFEQKFDEINNFSFKTLHQTTPVEAFGTKIRIDSPRNLLRQIYIMHYKNPSEFTVILETKTDFITLAMLEPRKTLKETLCTTTSGKPQMMKKNERLEIPKISLNLLQDFPECYGKVLLNGKKTNYTITKALQAIKFDLNEEGAEVRSEAAIETKLGRLPPIMEERPREYLFQKPFLIALKQKASNPPYFVAWIGNTEILKKKIIKDKQ
jgi:hypothetical protein